MKTIQVADTTIHDVQMIGLMWTPWNKDSAMRLRNIGHLVTESHSNQRFRVCERIILKLHLLLCNLEKVQSTPQPRKVGVDRVAGISVVSKLFGHFSAIC